MTHTYTDASGTYDIVKLWELTANLPCEEVPLSAIKGIKKSRRSGFSKKRLQAADTKFPILLSQENHPIDGRHRVIKSIEAGAKTIAARRPTPEQMLAARQ